jgi:hypothetical protein
MISNVQATQDTLLPQRDRRTMSILMLSYSDCDSAVAEPVAEIVRESGIDCVASPKGPDWDSLSTREFDGLIVHCLSLLLIVSPESLRSQWMPYETGYAKAYGKHILAYMTSSSLEIPGYLSNLEMLTSTDELCRHLEHCHHAAALRRIKSQGT